MHLFYSKFHPKTRGVCYIRQNSLSRYVSLCLCYLSGFLYIGLSAVLFLLDMKRLFKNQSIPICKSWSFHKLRVQTYPQPPKSTVFFYNSLAKVNIWQKYVNSYIVFILHLLNGINTISVDMKYRGSNLPMQYNTDCKHFSPSSN